MPSPPQQKSISCSLRKNAFRSRRFSYPTLLLSQMLRFSFWIQHTSMYDSIKRQVFNSSILRRNWILTASRSTSRVWYNKPIALSQSNILIIGCIRKWIIGADLLRGRFAQWRKKIMKINREFYGFRRTKLGTLTAAKLLQELATRV